MLFLFNLAYPKYYFSIYNQYLKIIEILIFFLYYFLKIQYGFYLQQHISIQTGYISIDQ